MTTLPVRAVPDSLFEWYDRIGRPTLRLVGVCVVALWGLALICAAFRSALTGVGMPDMTAGLAPLAGAIAMPLVDLVTRHREIMCGGGRSSVMPPEGLVGPGNAA